jgi:aarF domain-containing kinase
MFAHQRWGLFHRLSTLSPQRRLSRAHVFPPQSRAKPPGKIARRRFLLVYGSAILAVAGAGAVGYENCQPFRHTVLAVVRCSRIAEAAVLSAIDYKQTLARAYRSKEDEWDAYSQCHTRSAKRVLKALLANGGTQILFLHSENLFFMLIARTGVFIKMGQHMSSL